MCDSGMEWQDITLNQLGKIAFCRLLEALAWRIEMPWWATMLVMLAANLDIFIYLNGFFGDEGFMHLRFCKLIEQDGRKDGKKEPLYFINHELDLLRAYAKLPRYENAERVKKVLLAGLFLSKVLVFFPILSWYGVLFGPILVLSPEMLEAYFETKRTSLEQQLKDEKKHISERQPNEEFKKFENTRYYVTIAASILTTILLPVVITSPSEPSADFLVAAETERGSLMTQILPSYFTLAVSVAVKYALIVKHGVVIPKRFETCQWVLVLLTGIATIFFAQNKLVSLLPIAYLLASFVKSPTDRSLLLSTLEDFAQIVAALHCSFFIAQEFGLLDCIFGIALIFVHHVGKYKPGAVKLTVMFNFLYMQVCFLSLLTFAFSLESLNFAETTALWNQFPPLFYSLLYKIMVYTGILCLLLAGINQVRQLFDGETSKQAPDKYTNDYNVEVLASFVFREFLGIISPDKTTRQSINNVTKKTVIVLFMLSSLYWFNSWLSLFINLGFCLMDMYLTDVGDFLTVNLAFQMYILKHLIAYTEDFGFDERYLKLLFFDVSEVGRGRTCDFMLPYLEINTWSEAYHCQFETHWYFMVAYGILCYQLFTAILVRFILKPSPSDHSTLADFMLVLEELLVVTLVVTGISFGFYRDLIYISISLYLLLSRRRIAFDTSIH